MQLKLCGPWERWELFRLTDVPESWDNRGRGGCDIVEERGCVLVRAYTGPRTLSAGQRLDFHFRLLITPFKPIDPRHWSWRVGAIGTGANILHLHHASPPWNPYINYPFLTADRIAELLKTLRSIPPRPIQMGELTYPAEGNIDLRRGAVHIWVRVGFDPQVRVPPMLRRYRARFNQRLFYLSFPNGDEVGFYWNIDDRGMRVYIRKGPARLNRFPVVVGSRQSDWRRGERHVVTLSWGERLEIFVDGRRVAVRNYRGLLDTPLRGARLCIGGGFCVDAIKVVNVPFEGGSVPQPVPDNHTLLLDTFSQVTDDKTKPERIASGGYGTIEGTVRLGRGQFGNELCFMSDPQPQKVGINLYYTVRELSNHCPELWVLRSFGDEIFKTGGVDIFNDPQAASKGPKVGHPWLHEHLVAGYEPRWMHPFNDHHVDAAIATQGLSRWHNYYVEGLAWLMKKTGVDGLYLDGIGYDREVMKRVARVMHAINPQSRINFHSGDAFVKYRVSPANFYMEHFPYISSLWFGELFNYDMPPDYWLVEVSGIPFGLTGEMLNYRTGGNPYRGMIYGMVGRFHPSKPYLWEIWDRFGIQDAEMIGYWSQSCPVRTNRKDVLATVYRKPGESLIALAHWSTVSKLTCYVPRTGTPPKLDGRLSPGEWDNAGRITNFVVLGDDRLADNQTQVFITYDARHLYIAFRCAQQGKRLKANAKRRDERVWEDDSVEFFIQPDPNQETYFHFVGNARGVFADAKGLDRKWDGDWEYKTSVGAGSWEGEVRVSFASLGMSTPRDGVTVGFNACRNQQTPTQQLSSWSPMSDTFHNPNLFGQLVFSASKPPTREQLLPGGAHRAVTVRLRFDWKALGLDSSRALLFAPRIPHFQERAEFSPNNPIPVRWGKGWLFLLSESRGRVVIDP